MPKTEICDLGSLIKIMDSLDVGVIFIDKENRLAFINTAAEEIRKIRSVERIGTSIFECHGGKMNSKVDEVINGFRNGSYSTRHKMIKTGGRYFDNTYNVVKNDRGEYLGVVLLSQDVTEKKELEEKIQKVNEDLEQKILERTAEIESAYEQLKIVQQQLMQSEKMAAIGQFVAGVAHQINNPLDGIQNCLQAIKDEPQNMGQINSYIDLSLESLYKIELLVRKLLGYARPHSMEALEVDLNQLLENLLSLTNLRLKDKKITLKKSLQIDLPLFYGDAHNLEQVFVNIILNAFDAMENGGELQVVTETDQNNNIIVRIIDTGCGIPLSYLNKIFDPFFTTKKKNNGTGLGLYLSYNVIAQHRGKIVVKSKEGRGTEFKIVFPAADTNYVPENGIVEFEQNGI
jgi:PAS domain S-box-containing protein